MNVRELKKITNEEEYLAVIEVVEQLWESPPATVDAKLRDALVTLIEEYEDGQMLA